MIKHYTNLRLCLLLPRFCEGQRLLGTGIMRSCLSLKCQWRCPGSIEWPILCLPSSSLTMVRKRPNLTEMWHAPVKPKITRQKINIKLNCGFVALYNLQPGNGLDPFLWPSFRGPHMISHAKKPTETEVVVVTGSMTDTGLTWNSCGWSFPCFAFSASAMTSELIVASPCSVAAYLVWTMWHNL